MESDYWKKFRAMLQQGRGTLHLERIENSASSGHPDVRLMYRGRQYFFEMKAIQRKNPIPEPWMLLRPSQKRWHYMEVLSGGETHIINFSGDFCQFWRSIPLSAEDLTLRYEEIFSGQIENLKIFLDKYIFIY